MTLLLRRSAITNGKLWTLTRGMLVIACPLDWVAANPSYYNLLKIRNIDEGNFVAFCMPSIERFGSFDRRRQGKWLPTWLFGSAGPSELVTGTDRHG